MTDEQFTEAEEKFIEASIPVITIGNQLADLDTEWEAAQRRVGEAGDELGDAYIGRSGLARVNVLTHEAARRAGFGPDSYIVQQLDEAYAQVNKFLEALDQATAEAVTAGANPEI